MGQSGIFPFDREQVPWLPGTVKRTKAKIEERQVMTKRACCETNEAKPAQMRRKSHNRCSSEEILSPVAAVTAATINTTNLQSNAYCRLSASAPENNFLTPLGRQSLKSFSSVDESDEQKTELTSPAPSQKASPKKGGQGMVKNLKMNFEAKVAQETRKKGRSLPSSPVHIDTNQNQQPSVDSTTTAVGGGGGGKTEDILEDINVRNLVDKYEETKSPTTTITYRNSFPSSKNRTESRRRPQSVLETTTNRLPRPTTLNRQEPRPPLAPNCQKQPQATATLKDQATKGTSDAANNNNNSINNARKLLHHGRTHPLARLTDISKQKLNTSSAAASYSYNTM